MFHINEDGFALITAMIVLVVMAVMGIVATNTTTMDLLIAANDQDFKQNFYVADGGLNLESQFIPTYPLMLTVSEQRNHIPFYIVKSYDAGFPDDDSTDTTTRNAAQHYVGNQEYKYAVKFIRRKQALIKGEGARTVEVIYNQIESKKSDSASLICQIYRRVIK